MGGDKAKRAKRAKRAARTTAKSEDRARAARALPHEQVRAYVRDIFLGHGMVANDADTCAAALVQADLRGVWSHGVMRVPQYCNRLATGAIKARPAMKVSRLSAGAALVDGDDGIGLVVARRAMAEAIAIAKDHGVAIAAVKRSSHFGMAALYVMQAAHADCLGFAFTNASKALPPWGGKRAFFGTSPIAFAAPTPEGATFVVDMALSVVARGKIRHAAQMGEPIPEGCALDGDGRPTTDAAAAMAGVVLPMAGHKGAALSWMNDVLGGVYTGAAFGGEPANPTQDIDRPQLTGHLFMAMRADLFMPLDDFKARMGELDARAKAEPKADGFEAILAPGEPEARRMSDHKRHGIPLGPDVIADLKAYGDTVGAKWPFE